jgi:zinc transport system substrate-binding protein
MPRPFLPWLIGAALVLIGCTAAPDAWRDAQPGQKHILTTFAPLYCMTRSVAGDDAYVLCLLGAKGPHDFNDSPADMLKLHRADLILMNGLGLEPFMDRLIHGSGNKRAKVVKLGDNLPANLLLHSDEKGHMHADGKLHVHKGGHDPHVWLGPPQASAMVKQIGQELSELDPAHQAGYQKRAAELVANLEKLQDEGQALLKTKKNHAILTMHESLGYFAKAFDLDVVGSLQVQPGEDPNSNQLANLAKLCQTKDVRVIAVEPQYSPELAKTLQDHLRRSQHHEVQLVAVDPIETAPLQNGQPEPDFYLRQMRANITTLAKALP